MLVNNIRDLIRPQAIPSTTNHDSPATTTTLTTATPRTKRRLAPDSPQIHSSPHESSDSYSPSVKVRKNGCQIRTCNNNKAIDSCSLCDKLTCGKCVGIKSIICKKCSC